MGLKQLKAEDRIKFLQMFTGVMLISASGKFRTKQNIETAKIKKKFLGPEKEDLKDSIDALEKMPPQRPPMRRPAPTGRPMPPRRPGKPPVRPGQARPPAMPPKKRPVGFGVRQLEVLLQDASVQSVECPGPGKNVLVKRRNRINMTRLQLTKEEIIKVINEFARQARIPIVGGILKAAVGDLIISAVISEYAGSRFIINKKSPYALLEKKPAKK
jgi:hypothetical protein